MDHPTASPLVRVGAWHLQRLATGDLLMAQERPDLAWDRQPGGCVPLAVLARAARRMQIIVKPLDNG